MLCLPIEVNFLSMTVLFIKIISRQAVKLLIFSSFFLTRSPSVSILEERPFLGEGLIEDADELRPGSSGGPYRSTCSLSSDKQGYKEHTK